MDQHQTGPETGGNAARDPAVVHWPQALGATADDDVDAIISVLPQLPDVPVAGQAAVFERIHDELLADLEAGAD
jgi:hypothetical protein